MFSSQREENMDIIKTLFTGIVIGMANVIPGVSGGTLAVVFGIYDRFINAITFNVKKLWNNRRFVAPLLVGMLLGVLLFSKMIEFLYGHYPVQTNYVFTGLILGSIPMLFGYVFFRSYDKEGNAVEGEKIKLSAGKIVSLVVCVIAGFVLIMLFSWLEKKYKMDGTASLVFGEIDISVKLALRLLVAGFVGAVTMVIPGISGSLLMLIMGVYTIVITAIPAILVPATTIKAIVLLLPNGIGVLVGLLTGAKLISFLLKKAPNHVYGVIFGLICASAVTMFPGFDEINSVWMGIICFVCLLSGFALAFFTGRIDCSKENKTEEKNA